MSGIAMMDADDGFGPQFGSLSVVARAEVCHAVCGVKRRAWATEGHPGAFVNLAASVATDGAQSDERATITPQTAAIGARMPAIESGNPLGCVNANSASNCTNASTAAR